MTVSNTPRIAGPYVGNGIVTAFPFTFKIFDDGDLEVSVSGNGIDTILTLGSQYSITVNPDQDAAPGGTINYPLSGTPLPAGYRLTGIGSLEYEQQTDITNMGGFYPEVIEDSQDYQTILIQQLLEASGRTLTYPPSDIDVNGQIPPQEARAGMVLGFDGNGDPTVLPAGSGIITPASSVTYSTDTLDTLLRQNTAHSVPTIADLKLVLSSVYRVASTLGYYAPGDGGGGVYWADTGDGSSADNGGSVIVANDGMRWKLYDSGSWSLLQFGAKNDATGDARTPLLNALVARRDAGGGEVYVPGGTYLFPNRIRFESVTNGIHLRGAVGSVFRSTAAAGDIPFGDAQILLCWTHTAPFEISGITFDNQNLVTTNRSTSAIAFISASNINIHHCRIVNCMRYAIAFNGVSDSRVSNCVMSRTSTIGASQRVDAVTNDGGRVRVTVLNTSGFTNGRRVLMNETNITGGRGLFAVDATYATTPTEVRLRGVTSSSLIGAVSATGINGGAVRCYVDAAAYAAITAYATGPTFHDLLWIPRINTIAAIAFDTAYTVSATGTQTRTVSGCTNSGGLIRVAFTAPHGLQTNAGITIAGVTGTTEANGTWAVTLVSATDVTLQGSVFVNAYVGGPGTGVSNWVDLGNALWQSGDAFSAGGIVTYSIPSVYAGNPTLSVSNCVKSGTSIQVTLSSTATLRTGSVITISGVTGTVEANGTWTVTVVSPGLVLLQGSTFTNAYVAGGSAAWQSGGYLRIANEYQNQAIIGSGINSRNMVHDSYLRGFGLLLAGADWDIARNVVRDCDYGAAIAFEADANTVRARVVDNIMMDGYGLDVNITQVSGLECWAPYSIVVGNIAYNNANAGFQIGGIGSKVNNNIAVDNGSYNSQGTGLYAMWQSGGIYGNYMDFSGNTCIDSGVDYQLNGYAENDSATFIGISVKDNKISGAFTTVPYTFAAGSTQTEFRGREVSGSASLNYASTGALAVGQSQLVGGISVPGAVVGDYVDVALDLATLPSNGFRALGHVSGANSVAIWVQNTTAAPATPTAGSYLTRVNVRQRKP